jgi:hypothetical protein
VILATSALSSKHQGKDYCVARRIQKIFTDLIDDLPLRKGIDRRYLRLTVMGTFS